MKKVLIDTLNRSATKETLCSAKTPQIEAMLMVTTSGTAVVI